MTDSILFSIIIPCRNEERHIGDCLNSLLCQDLIDDYEIIVVDGMSEDSTRDIISEYVTRDKRVIVISNPEKITPTAMNRGISRSKGDIILVFGAHWHVKSDFLRQIKNLFNRYQVDCMGGRIMREVKNEKGYLIEKARASLLGGGLSIRNNPDIKEQIVHVPNIAFIYRRRVFERVGLFDERFVKNQDNEFNFRTIQSGFQTLYSPRIVFHYFAPDNFRKLFWQMYNYASYTPMEMVKHRKLFKAHFALPAIAFIAWLIFIVLGLTNILSLNIAFTLLAAYALILIIGSIILSIQAKKISKWYLVFHSLVTIHVGVLSGYLHGICRLLNPSLTISLWEKQIL